ncbi:MAG: hypothetical protein AB8I08_08970 [Sandaracinaceae bacterium]
MRARPITLHSKSEAVARRCVDWARSHRLVLDDIEAARARRIRVGELAAHTFTQESEDVVQLGADLILWLYLFDDAIGERPDSMDESEHRAVLKSYSDTLAGQKLPREPSPFHVALLNLAFRAIELGATDAWIRRFQADLDGYFSGCADETQWREAGEVPSITGYRDLRARSVGTRPVFAIIELGQSGLVSDEEMADPRVQDARAIAAMLTAWVNDLYSFPKEYAAGDRLNLVNALSGQFGLGLEDALDEAAQVYNLDYDQLDAVIAELSPSGSPELRRYLEALVDWVDGNRAWTRLCERYA